MTFEEFLEEWRGPGKVIKVHTSGSTGKPKTISLDKEFVRAGAMRTNSFFAIDSRSRLHSCVAADYIGGKMMAVRSDVAQCRLTWETPSNRPLTGLSKDDVIDLLAVVPSQMLHILSHLDEMPQIKAVIIGGSAIHPRLKEKIIASGLNAYETYGMTETASHIALRKIAHYSEWFLPLPGITVAQDDRGCLVINFDSGEGIITNDIASINAAGGFKILGRYDNVIITGGKKVNPEDVERRIAPFIEGDFVVTSRTDEKWGERVVLLIEASSEKMIEASEENSNEVVELLREKLRGVLEPFEMPKEITFVSKLARTPNGKILRHRL